MITFPEAKNYKNSTEEANSIFQCFDIYMSSSGSE